VRVARRSTRRWSYVSQLAVVLTIPLLVASPAVVVPAWGQPAPPPGATDPFSISLRIDGGSAQDMVHAMYRPGQQLRLKAVIRDSSGRETQPTQASPCTPVYDIEPEGSQSAWMDPVQTDVVHFGPGLGVFSVRVRCQEQPHITSAGRNEANFNFESSRSRWAPPVGPPIVAPPQIGVPSIAPGALPPEPPAAKAKGGGGALGGVLLAALVVGGAYYLIKALGANEGDCACSCSDGTTCTAGSNDCGVSGGVAIPCGCPVAGDSFNCDGRGGKARLGPGPATIHDVTDIVAVGFAQQREDKRRGSARGARNCDLAPTKPSARDVVTPHVHQVTRAGDRWRTTTRESKTAPTVRALALVASQKRGTGVAAAITRKLTNATHGLQINAAQVGTALGVAIATYAWISWLRHPRQEAPSLQLSPWIQADAGGFNVAGHF